MNPNNKPKPEPHDLTRVIADIAFQHTGKWPWEAGSISEKEITELIERALPDIAGTNKPTVELAKVVELRDKVKMRSDKLRTERNWLTDHKFNHEAAVFTARVDELDEFRFQVEDIIDAHTRSQKAKGQA